MRGFLWAFLDCGNSSLPQVAKAAGRVSGYACCGFLRRPGLVAMQDSAYGSSHGAFLQKPLDADEEQVPNRRVGKSCKFSTDFGPRDVADEIAYDVDQLHDELPQPYRFVNQLINQLVSDATDKTFVDKADASLATGQLDWRVPEAEQVVGLPPDKILRPVAALPLGQIACWAAIQGTPFRIAVDQVGTMIAYQMQSGGAREVCRATEAVALDHTAVPPASIVCCGRGPLGALAVVYTAQHAKVFALGIQAPEEEDEVPADDDLETPSFGTVAATLEFDSPARLMTIAAGLLASVHDDHARVYELPIPRPESLEPVAEDAEAEQGEAPLQPWVRTEAVAVNGSVVTGKGMLDFIQAPVPGSVVGGAQRTDVVGLLLYWSGAKTLRRYELPSMGMSPPESGEIAPKFEWACSSAITASAMDPTTTLYITGHADGGVAVWDNRLAALHRMLPSHKAAVTALAFGRDPLIASVCGGDEPRLHVCDVDSGVCYGVLDGAVSCKVLPNRRTALCAMPGSNGDDSIGVVELLSAELIGMLHVKEDPSKLLQGGLKFELLCAADLPNCDAVGASDPYCQLKLGGFTQATEPVQNQLNPEFNSTLNMPILDVGSGLKIEIWDQDATTGDDNLAYGYVDLTALVPELSDAKSLGGPTPQWSQYRIVPDQNEQGEPEPLAGAIAVRLHDGPRSARGDAQSETHPEMFFRVTYEPAVQGRFPATEVDENCVTVCVPAAVSEPTQLQMPGGNRPCTPQAAHVFDLPAVVRELYAERTTSETNADGAEEVEGAAATGGLSLPPSQYPPPQASMAAAAASVSLTAGHRHGYSDAAERVARHKLESSMQRDSREERMARRRAEITATLQG